ncbi:hypothetical protein THARTR1_02242 [Trichoderma harzianum]|uniref:Uncharacterized protein n=1 Tax=Trichoderma harzianum TaxID=5544 RepID=A0A2K0UJY3_TRIHA|nr:hypothetical protein THARTR1_02242 [Trichoderma harzianum]
MRKKELQKQQQQGKNHFSKWVFYVDPRTEDAQQDGRPLDRKRFQWRLAQTQPTSSLDDWKASGSELAVASRSHYSAGFNDVFLSPKYRDEMFRFFCKLSTAKRAIFFRRLYELVTRHVAQHTLDSQLLLSVMQFNVIRAAGANAATIGIGMDVMAEDIISPFYTGAGTQLALPFVPGSSASYDKEQHLPPNLQPTALQKLVIHHPWIDVCAQPSLRNALLRRLHNLDEDEFCHYLFLQSGESDKDGMIGMVVWGEAWDPASYEISATMIRKWPWIVNECPDIIRTTNYWRAKRQEGPLKIL